MIARGCLTLFYVTILKRTTLTVIIKQIYLFFLFLKRILQESISIICMRLQSFLQLSTIIKLLQLTNYTHLLGTRVRYVCWFVARNRYVACEFGQNRPKINILSFKSLFSAWLKSSYAREKLNRPKSARPAVSLSAAIFALVRAENHYAPLRCRASICSKVCRAQWIRSWSKKT